MAQTDFSIHVIMHGDDKRRKDDFQLLVTAFLRQHTGYTVIAGGAETCHALMVYGPDHDKLHDLHDHLAMLAHMVGLKATALVAE
jgi:hypothetical protein